MTEHADRSQLQQIIDGLSEGVILIERDQTIAYANEAALALHGVTALSDLGVDVTAYTQTDIADAMDVSSVHVNRVLKEMRGQGLITLHSQTLVIQAWEKLLEASEFDATYLRK